MSSATSRVIDRLATRSLSLLVVAVLLILPLYSSGAAASTSANSAITPIKHVVIVTMENHSFDNVFGNYPFGGNSSAAGLTSDITVPSNLVTSGTVSNLTAVPPGQANTANPVEGYTAYHLDWNNGKMNGFRANSGPQSMTYFSASQMAPEWVLAQQFALGDMYFATALTATMPNRLYGIAGYSPVINDYGIPPYIPFSQSIFGELNHYGVSWSYYIAYPQEGLDVLSYFYGITQYTSNVRSWNNFMSQAANNSLPAVSYISPIGVGVTGYSQHPSYSMIVGELWLYRVVQSIMHSPSWNSTAVFINYDEGGGYYDHVPPPVTGGQQLGFRVPLIVISPYAKENYVSSTVMNHASLLAFIDYNWNMPALNGLVSKSNLPLDMFTGLSGSVAPRPAVALPSFPGFEMPPTMYFQQGNVTKSSLSSLFPANPQFPFAQLPYARSGSSSFSLSQNSSALFVQRNSAYTPLSESDGLVAFLLALSLAGCYLIIVPRRNE